MAASNAQNANIKYLFSLVEWFSSIGEEMALCRKIKNYCAKENIMLGPVDYSIFCFKCRILLVPVATGKFRVTPLNLEVECLKCTRKHTLEIRDKTKDVVKRRKTEHLTIESLLDMSGED